jgi:hypothetical protein
MKWIATDRALGLLLGVIAGVLGSSCSEADTAGQLVIAIGTDLAMPQQIDNVYVRVEVHGQPYLDTTYPVGPREQDYTIPATLTLVAGSSGQPVTVRVAGQRRGEWRTFREVVTTVPPDRSALLRLPIQWLCDESAKQSGSSHTPVLSSCEQEGYSCRAGKCVPNLLEREDEDALPEYTPEQVFGGAADPDEGLCFDTIGCMSVGHVVEPDADCSVDKPDSGSPNLALRVTDDGICDSGGTTCFVPLDQDAQLGWSERDGRLQLPEAACAKLSERKVNAIYLSTMCQTKTPAFPPCGGWSRVGRVPGKQITSSPASQMMLARAEELTQLLPEKSQLCCPLLAESGKLYTCACASKSNATLLRVDPNAHPPDAVNVGSINPPDARDLMRFPAALSEGALYWAAGSKIQRTPLAGSSSNGATFDLAGAVYERSTLLAGPSGVFVLATGLSAMSGAPVQILGVGPKNERPIFDTGGTQPVYQFAQDDRFLYLAVDVDTEADGGPTRRTSSVVQMNKVDGALVNVLPAQTITVSDPLRGGGYTGVQVDRQLAYALFEGMPAASGAIPVRVERVDLVKLGSATPIYQTTVDPGLSQLGLLGTLDGAVVLTRIDFASAGSKQVRSSSVLVVNEAGIVRVIADFPGPDFPGPGLASDDERVYWLNSSGRLFGFPRTGLH